MVVSNMLIDEDEEAGRAIVANESDEGTESDSSSSDGSDGDYSDGIAKTDGIAKKPTRRAKAKPASSKPGKRRRESKPIAASSPSPKKQHIKLGPYIS